MTGLPTSSGGLALSAPMALSSFVDGRLWGVRQGTGRPWLLALHGWGRDHSDFTGLVSGTDAVVLDLPGFGASPEPPEPWSTAQYADLVASVLDGFGGAAVVVGHSFGARVAVHLTLDRRVRALVLTGAPLANAPGHVQARPHFAYRAGRALHRARLLGDRRMERLRQRYGSEDYRNASEVMRGVLVKSVRETAESAYVPLLRDFMAGGGSVELVWGEGDSVASLTGLRSALSGLSDDATHVTVVPRAGHLLTPGLTEQLRAAALRHRPGPQAR